MPCREGLALVPLPLSHGGSPGLAAALFDEQALALSSLAPVLAGLAGTSCGSKLGQAIPRYSGASYLEEPDTRLAGLKAACI